MEPQILFRSDSPNVTYTTSGKLMPLQRLRGEAVVAVGIVRYDSTTAPKSPLAVETERAQVVAVTIRDIEVDGRIYLRRKQPLELVAHRHEPGGCYHADFPDLDVPLAGYSRDDLVSEAHALIVSTWRRCMGADEEMLAPLALMLKERLRTQYDEVV